MCGRYANFLPAEAIARLFLTGGSPLPACRRPEALRRRSRPWWCAATR